MAAKPAQKTNKSNHGKQNPINMGNVKSSVVNSEAGRARKKAERLMAEQSKKRVFEQRCAAALPIERLLETLDNPSLLGSEFVAPVKKTVKVLVKKTDDNPSGFEMKEICGHIIVLAEPGKEEGLPVVRVAASDFDAIPASSIFLPLTFVFKREFFSYLPAEFTEVQRLLHGALRAILKNEIEERLSLRHLLPDRKVVAVSVSKEPVEEEPVVAPQALTAIISQPAVQLRVSDLTSHQRDWSTERNFLYLASDLGVAHFRRVVMSGAPKLELVKTTDDHPLASLLDEHGMLQCDIKPVFDQGFAPEVGDMHDVRVARKVMQNYLRRWVLQTGFKPVWAEAAEASAVS